jgi:hypothetical protein
MYRKKSNDRINNFKNIKNLLNKDNQRHRHKQIEKSGNKSILFPR